MTFATPIAMACVRELAERAAAVQHERYVQVLPDQHQVRQVEVALSVQHDMRVADADRQQVTPVSRTNATARLGSVSDSAGGWLPSPQGSVPNSASTATPLGWARGTHFGHAAGKIGVTRLRIGQHHDVEAGLNGAPHPAIGRALIEHQRGRDRCRFGRRAAQRCVPIQPGGAARPGESGTPR